MKIVALVLQAVVQCLAQSPQQPVDQVTKFCKMEFDGITDERASLICYSKLMRAKIGKQQDYWGTANDPVAIDIREDPVMIVGSFKILDVVVDKLKGHADVEYLLLGETVIDKSNSYNLDVVNRVKIRHDPRFRVRLNLVFIDGKSWCIQDPPVLKVSKDAILKVQRDDMNRIVGNFELNQGEPLPHLKALVERKKKLICEIESL